jgi:hypothetical protein
VARKKVAVPGIALGKSVRPAEDVDAEDEEYGWLKCDLCPAMWPAEMEAEAAQHLVEHTDEEREAWAARHA